MQSNEQKLREALRAYQDANEMSPYGDYSKIEWESSAGPVNPNWGGGDCKKHGRWYGRCYSCSDEWENLRKRADRDAYTARENALNAAKQMARQALALPTATPAGERDRFEKWAREQFYSGLACPSDTWSDERKTYNDAAHHMAFCAFQAALIAGDAVDAGKFHKLFEAMDEGRASIIVEGATRSIDGGEIFTDIDDALDAIDSAMRKGQL